MKKKVITSINLIVLISLWGSYAAVSKMLLFSLDSYQLLFYTFMFASVVLASLNIFTGTVRHISVKQISKMPALILPGFFCFGYYFFYNQSLSKIPAVQASILNYTFPLWMVIISAIVNKKIPRLHTIFAVVAGFAGVILVLTNSTEASVNFGSDLNGALLALASAICWGGFSIAGSKVNTSPLVASAVYNVESLLLSTVALIAFSKFVIPGLSVLASLFYIGAFTVAIPYYLWFTLINKLGIEKMAAFSYLIPFSTLIFISLLLREPIGTGHFIGLLVIVGACLLEMLTSNRGKRGKEGYGAKTPPNDC